MIQLLRRLIHSRIGAIVAVIFLVLIALAFASADISGSNTFGGVAGGDRVATVGKQRIDAANLSQATSTALENMKREDPKASMKAFLAQGGLDQVLEQIIDRTAIGEFGRASGIIAGNRLVDSEIAKIAVFRGPDGKFSDAAFRQALAQRGISEKLVREDLAQGLVARQILVPAAFGSTVPDEFVLRYAALLKETRSGTIAMLPSAAFVPATLPAEAELTAFYKRRQNDFIQPERRTIRYAVFGDSALKSVPTPSDAEIAARYNANKAQYAALETRSLTQVIAPTEAIARAIAADAAKAGGLDAAAKAKGLAASKLVALAKPALVAQSSQAVADAAFAAPSGSIAAPARSGLGWHVVRVDAVQLRAGRSLEQARGEIAQTLAVEKRRAAINDLSARLEDEFDNGGNLTEAAKELGVEIRTAGPLLGDGTLYGKPGEKAPADVARLVSAAFAMEAENEPQVAEVVPGQLFAIFDVADIQAAAPPPLGQIKVELARALMLEKGAVTARASAAKVVDAVRKGAELQAALASLGKPLPGVDSVNLTREDLARMQGRVPAPIGLLFAMAQGTVKMLPAPGNQGWYVVSLKRIVPGTVAKDDPLLASAHKELGLMVGREYAEGMRRAIRAEVGVTKNPTAIKAVGAQLNGGN